MSELLFDGMTLTVEIGFSTDGVPNSLPIYPLYFSDIDWTDVTINVNVAPTADKAAIGQTIVEAISSYERRSGPGWRS